MYAKVLRVVATVCFFGALSATVREYRDVRELNRGQRAAIAEGVTHQLNLPRTVRNDMLDALFAETEVSTEQQQIIVQLAQEAEEIQEQIEALKTIDGFADDHEAVRLLEQDKARIENRIRETLYDDPYKFQTIAAAGIAMIAGMLMYRNRVPDFVDSATEYVDVRKLLPKKMRPKDPRILKSLVATVILFALIEFSLRGRNALVVPRLIEMSKKAANGIGFLGGEMFKDGGLADKFQAWIEDVWRSLSIDERIKENRSTIIDATLVTGLLGTIIYLARLETVDASSK